MAFCTNCGSEMDGPFCASCGARSGESAPASGQPVGEPAAAQQPPAKKSKVLVYVLAGCGGLIVITLVGVLAFVLFIRQKVGDVSGNPALAAARVVAALNPNVEVVSTDERAGKITLRDKQTGKTVTFDASDVQKGHISFEGDSGERVEIQGQGEGGSGSVTVKGPDGSMQFGEGSLAKVPDWVPKYPGAQAVGTFTMQGGTGDAGTFQLKCGGSVDQVASFFEREMKGAGMAVQKNSMQSDGGGTTIVIGQDEASGRTVSATVSSSSEGTVAQITYQTKK